MGRHVWVFGLIGLAMSQLMLTAWADDWDACKNKNPDVSIFGCSAIIDAGTETQSNLAIAYINRGSSYANKGQYDRANKDYDKASALNPKDAEAYYGRGIVYYNKGQYDRAIKDYDKAIALNPKHTNAYFNRGLAYSRKDQYDRAIEDYDKVSALNPKDADAYHGRGAAFYYKGQYDRAIKDFDKAIALNPKFAHSYYGRGLAYYSKGQYDRAIQDYDKAIALNPKDADAFGNRGLAYEQNGNSKRAKADFLKAISLRKDDRVGTAGLQRLNGVPSAAAVPEDKPKTAEKPTKLQNTKFKHLTNTDLAGALLAKAAAKSVTACEAQCKANSACEAFTFNAWNAMCFLKTDVTAQVLEPSSISGYPTSGKPPPKSKLPLTMVRYRGKSFDVSKAKAIAEPSFEDCEASCEETESCAVFTWLSEGEDACYMLPRVDKAYETDPQFDSGVKRQVAN